MAQGHGTPPIGPPVWAEEDLGGIDNAAVEVGGKRGVDVADDSPDVRAVELTPAMGAACAVDRAGEQSVDQVVQAAFGGGDGLWLVLL